MYMETDISLLRIKITLIHIYSTQSATHVRNKLEESAKISK
jgi:hypothetical protein